MKILFVGDSPALHTGFGHVLKTIALHLSDNTEWEIKCIGWFDNGESRNSMLPFDIIPTNGTMQDVYGQQTFEQVVQAYKPDVVFAIGDAWMVKPYTESQYRDTYKLIMYSPIDGSPIPKEWCETFKKADVFVAYGNWGKKVIQDRDSSFPISVIPHGIDTSVFHKKDVERIKPFTKDSFIVGCVARNQPRKNLPAFLKMYSQFNSSWIKCYDCNAVIYVENMVEQKCLKCKSANFKFFPKKTNAFGYMHCSLDDCGWDLQDLIERYGLKRNIVFPKHNTVGGGISDKLLSDIYNMMDVFTLPTTGEGFGLPIMEAMACGVPCLVTGYSAHLEYCRDSAELINVGYFMTEPKSNVERALVDIEDYVMKLDRMYYDKQTFITKYSEKLFSYGITDFTDFIDGKQIRINLGKKGMDSAVAYDWKNILPIWMELFKKFENKEIKTNEFRIEKV